MIGCRTDLPDGQYYAVTAELVRIVQRVARRLYSEDRMNADVMRDNAQALDYVLMHLEPFDVNDLVQERNEQTGEKNRIRDSLGTESAEAAFAEGP